jgi:hypothetical protein
MNGPLNFQRRSLSNARSSLADAQKEHRKFSSSFVFSAKHLLVSSIIATC